ncbi:MAG: hypothetical protein OXB92_13460 [Acidimicrobiaceae bacterium]|nr:hypothetical protein [Acidimicrobiia bacterium]MCY4494857.1 hypothetical protein [Acidimicrobiaceae bacterium]
METPVIQTISILGGAVLLLFGWFIRIVITKIDQINTRIDRLEDKIDRLEDKFEAKFDGLEDKFEAKFDRLDEKFAALTSTVAAIAATQAEHGAILEHMMGHGERISALEGAIFKTAGT